MIQPPPIFSFFFFNDTATTEIYTLSLHDALPISQAGGAEHAGQDGTQDAAHTVHATHVADIIDRSEEHTSELQSRLHLVCRLLLEKKKHISTITPFKPHSIRLALPPYRTPLLQHY